MEIDSLLIAILVVLTLSLILVGVSALFLINIMREIRAEQEVLRRAVANMDWTMVLSKMQSSFKEAVRILDIIDKRLQKLEALEKVQISQFKVGR